MNFEEERQKRTSASAQFEPLYGDGRRTDNKTEPTCPRQQKKSTKRVSGSFDTLFYCLIVVTATVLLNLFVISPMQIVGGSMEGTLKDSDIVLISKLAKSLRKPKRYEVYVVKVADEEKTEDKIVKRVIALPGEAVFADSEGKIHIFPGYEDGEYIGEEIILKEEYSYTGGIRGRLGTPDSPLVLRKNEYFLLGDNRSVSRDSRSFGPFTRKSLLGRVVLRVLPLRDFGGIR